MKPVDTAGKGIAAILELKDENKQLRNDLERMITARNGAFSMMESLIEQIKVLRGEQVKRQHESQDYSMLAGLLLFVWLGFIGLVING